MFFYSFVSIALPNVLIYVFFSLLLCSRTIIYFSLHVFLYGSICMFFPSFASTVLPKFLIYVFFHFSVSVLFSPSLVSIRVNYYFFFITSSTSTVLPKALIHVFFSSLWSRSFLFSFSYVNKIQFSCFSSHLLLLENSTFWYVFYFSSFVLSLWFHNPFIGFYKGQIWFIFSSFADKFSNPPFFF